MFDAVTAVEQIVRDTKPGTMLEFENETYANVGAFRQAIRMRLRIHYPQVSKRVVLSVQDNKVIAYHKAPNRMEALEAILEKVMIAVDDEKLYEECMEVLYGSGSQ